MTQCNLNRNLVYTISSALARVLVAASLSSIDRTPQAAAIYSLSIASWMS